jgi:hypothetical protein
MQKSRSLTKAEQENLSVPDTYPEKVAKAVRLYQNYPAGVPAAWRRKDCYLERGVKKTAFFGFLAEAEAGDVQVSDVLSKGGRPRLLTEEALQELYDEVQEKSLNLKSVKAGPPFYKMTVEKMQSCAKNQLAEIAPSKTYMKELVKMFTVVDNADEKNKSRLKQFENIRNGLSSAQGSTLIPSSS